MYSKLRIVGNVAEDATVSYLKSAGFRVLDRNYLKSFGELDIVAERDGMIHFIEVKSKTISRENGRLGGDNFKDKVSQLFSRLSFTNNKLDIVISREMDADDMLEENFHKKKRDRMYRAVSAYLDQKKLTEREWQIDLIAVKLDFSKRTAIIKHIDCVTFD